VIATAQADAVLAPIVEMSRRAALRPLDYVRWTPPQRAFLESRSKFKLLRTGNQFGKTWAGAADTIWFALGRHPFREVPQGPTEQWIVCKSWSQSISIQRKLWDLLPKDEIVEDTVFRPKSGFAGTQKAVEFRNGSIIRIKTIGQDNLDLASATLHRIWIDEPLGDAETFSELQMRLRRTGGEMAITMTPATTGDLEWLRELIEAGQVEDLHYRMEARNFIPVGTERPLRTEDGVSMDSAWVEREIESTLSWARPVRCHGEWEYGRISAVFENFRPQVHVVPNLLQSDVAPKGEVLLSVGADYGEERLRTTGNLGAVDEHPTVGTRVFILSEYAPDSSSTIDMDAVGFLEMIARVGISWDQLDFAWGDKRYTDARGRITRKSNAMLTRAIEKHLQKRHGIRPKFKGAKRGIGGGKGAVWTGIRWLNDRMITPGAFYIDASCVRTIQCFQKWQGGPQEEWKDQLDDVRYLLRPWIFPRRRQSRSRVRFG
jgi:hypothetical protein